LLQTHFVYKFFLFLKGKKERVFFVNFFILQSCNFLLETTFWTEKNTISEFLFFKFTINKLYLLGKINGDGHQEFPKQFPMLNSSVTTNAFFLSILWCTKKWWLCKGRFSQIWLPENRKVEFF
jgi:hypothetical protein